MPAAPPLPSTPSHTLLGHEGAVLAVRFNAAGTYCLSCGKDRSLRLWNPHSGVAVKTYTGQCAGRVCARERETRGEAGARLLLNTRTQPLTTTFFCTAAVLGHGYDVRDVVVSADNAR